MNDVIKSEFFKVKGRLDSMRIILPDINKVINQSNHDIAYKAYLTVSEYIIHKIESYEMIDLSEMTENYTEPELLALSRGFEYTSESGSLLYLLVIDFLLTELQLSQILNSERSRNPYTVSLFPNSIESEIQSLYNQNIQNKERKDANGQIQELLNDLKSRDRLLINRNKVTESMCTYLENLNLFYSEDMTLRKQLLEQRLVVTIQSCSMHLKESLKQEMNKAIHTYYEQIQNSIHVQLDIQQIFNQRESLLTQMNTPSIPLPRPHSLLMNHLQDPLTERGIIKNQLLQITENNPSISKRHNSIDQGIKNRRNIKRQKKGICYDFKNGFCRYGNSCKYSHDL